MIKWCTIGIFQCVLAHIFLPAQVLVQNLLWFLSELEFKCRPKFQGTNHTQLPKPSGLRICWHQWLSYALAWVHAQLRLMIVAAEFERAETSWLHQLSALLRFELTTTIWLMMADTLAKHAFPQKIIRESSVVDAKTRFKDRHTWTVDESSQTKKQTLTRV